MENDNIEKKTWDEFRASKMLWFINRIIHVFGWAILIEADDEGKITGAFPARVKFRGFGEDAERRGYIGLSEYLKDNAEGLLEEAKQ